MLWCPIRVYAGIGVVVVGGREVLLFKFSTFHSIENTCKKIFLWEYLPGGGGLEPTKPPPPPHPTGAAPESGTLGKCLKTISHGFTQAM